MKITKSQKSNLFLLSFVLIMLFTPLGGLIKEYSAKVLAANPKVIVNNNLTPVSVNEWKLKGINTDNYNFSDSKGKIVFVNFWATWCPPCRAEMPSIQSLYEAYSDKIEFILISDEGGKKIQSFLERNQYTFPVYNQLNYPPRAFDVTSIPATYILNKRGEIVVHEIGAVNWNSDDFKVFLDQLIAE